MPHLAAAASTDRGRTRRRNEDAVVLAPELGLAIVADGMGGHPAGDVASRLAVTDLLRQLSDGGSLPTFDRSSSGSLSPMGERMAEAVRRVDARVRAEGAAADERAGMGTTLTSILVEPGGARAIVAHVGDSRAYVYDDGRLRQLTRDHTWVQQQIDAGALDAGDARGHPWAHVLSQALGVGDDIAPDVVEVDTEPGQIYLLCTDGLTTMLPDAAIERTLHDALARGLDEAARALIDAANDRGGADNITVALVGIA